MILMLTSALHTNVSMLISDSNLCDIYLKQFDNTAILQKFDHDLTTNRTLI